MLITKDNFSTAYSYFGRQSIENAEEIQLENPENGEIEDATIQNAKAIFTAKGRGGVPYERMYYLIKTADACGIKLNTFSASKLLTKEHGSTNADFTEYLTNYKKRGITKVLEFGSDWSKEELEEKFKAKPRFNGRTPQILNEMASVMDTYGISADDIVGKFDIATVRNLRNVGIPDAEVVILYTNIPSNQLARLKDDPALCENIASFLSKGILEDEGKLVTIAKWIASHPNTDKGIINDLLEHPYSFRITLNSTVEKIDVQRGGLKAIEEIKEIERAYKKPKFKFEECKCELIKTTVSNEKYKAYILDENDPRQVMLGHETNCCQVLGDAGETAMLHGLLHPRAGFWAVVDAETDKLRCQAEAWEYDDETLVFDNIEFADDTEISRYKEIIGKWLVNSPYKNVLMGLGYNEMANSSFKESPDLTPPVTPREIYVMSYEEDAEIPDFCDRTALNKRETDRPKDFLKLPSEAKAKELLDEGRINYYDYLYSDVDDRKGMVWLKEGWEIADYFGIPKEEQDHAKSEFEDTEKKERFDGYAQAVSAYFSRERE